jgi:biotin---protein ligase
MYSSLAIINLNELQNRNIHLTSLLPTGTVCLASHQTTGRGRGNNSWISQAGCLQFSFLLRHTNRQTIVFIQYLVALVMVETIREFNPSVPAFIKWPNDIYIRETKSNPQEVHKIGGILVTASYNPSSKVFDLVVGLGINVSNAFPTTCLNDYIADKSESRMHSEELLARFLNRFETAYECLQFNETDGQLWTGFDLFCERYYGYWLHSDQVVRLQDHGDVDVKITGITRDGFLRTVGFEKIDGKPISYELMSGGNSFDLMKGLILTKK